MFGKILSLFRRDDRFLVLEIFDKYVRGALIKADPAEKQVRVLRFKEGNSADDAGLKKFLKHFGNLSGNKIILGLDSHLATTVYAATVVVRDNFKDLIDEPNLDNLISQAIWKFFDRQRTRVASKMSVSDMDIVLSDVRIRGIKLDGHKVVNPLGFKAKSVEIQFSQTFLTRDIVNRIKKLFPKNQILFVGECGTTWSNVIGQATEADNFVLANLFFDKTSVFIGDRGQRNYWDNFLWGQYNVMQSLAEELLVSAPISKEIIRRYLTDNMSPALKRRLETIFMKELHLFANSLSGVLAKTDTKMVYVHALFEVPNLFSNSFKNKFDRPVTLVPVDLDLVSQNLGFKIECNCEADNKQLFGLLAHFMEWQMSPMDDKMSQIAMRRVRWLAPTGNPE